MVMDADSEPQEGIGEENRRLLRPEEKPGNLFETDVEITKNCSLVVEVQCHLVQSRCGPRLDFRDLEMNVIHEIHKNGSGVISHSPEIVLVEPDGIQLPQGVAARIKLPKVALISKEEFVQFIILYNSEELRE